MGVRWTEEQQKVIDLRNCNILVSAAAGSGKTAVLVERIIQRILHEDPPMNVDELLIVTFTEAAATEMKERILNAIEKALEEKPDNVHLQRQESLLHTAMITTIHSFCLSVIREHFHVRNLDPSFRILEEGEWKLLRKDVMDDFLEEEYAKKTPAFLEFIERYTVGKDDRKVEEMILQLYDYARSMPNPFRWLDRCVESYEVPSVEALEQSAVGQLVVEQVRYYTEDAMELLQEGIAICQEAGGPYMYEETLKEEWEGWNFFAKASSLEELWERKSMIAGGRLKANRDKAVSPELAEQVKEIRKQTKAFADEISKTYLFRSPEEMCRDMVACKESVAELVRMVKGFADAFAEKKREKNVIDFEDMEHLALQILTEETETGLKPSMVAKEYQKRFQEVMIDEYQDSNLIQEALLTSVSRIWEGQYNLFMVGDVKQSIYRFRLSRPELFMEKYETYSLDDSEQQRIDLHKNFRSRREVLDSTNNVFRQIMRKELGGIAYDDNAALYVGSSYEEHPGNETELLLVDLDKEELELEKVEESKKELEARAIARRIKQLREEHEVFDQKTGTFRKVQYKDIVILTRSLKGWTDTFASILNREGIPTYTGSKEGYFETQEIETILNYLRVLDNPRQDLPLTAILTSPIVGLRGEQLAMIRLGKPDGFFYTCVENYFEIGTDVEICEKLKRFTEQLEYFRNKLSYTSIHDLLWEIYEETGYYAMVSAMPGGRQRQANMDMLLEKAKIFEGTSYQGVFQFVRYMEQLKKYDIDYGEANLLQEDMDTVHLMSIHKSKGLEFPIVFVAGMNKRFHKQDLTKDVMVHSDYGIGVDWIDPIRRTKAPTFLKKMIQRLERLESIGEELRILYVAMTRAKEKLILTGTIEHFEKQAALLESFAEYEKAQMPFTMIASANSYLDWLLPCFWKHVSMRSQIHVIGLQEILEQELDEEVQERVTAETLFHIDCEKVYDEAYRKQLQCQFTYVYPHQQEEGLKLKYTVSELKKVAIEDSDAEPLVPEESTPILPKKLQEQGVGGAARGTIYHKVMEQLRYEESYTKERLQNELDRLLAEGILTEEMVQCVYQPSILQFLRTDVAARMRMAAQRGCLHKEQPFVLGVSPTEVDPNCQSDEMVLIQGVIDVWFEEEDGIVVLDYKTDRAATEEELITRYERQLDYYGMALERLQKKKIKEKLIYSFAFGKEIRLKNRIPS